MYPPCSPAIRNPRLAIWVRQVSVYAFNGTNSCGTCAKTGSPSVVNLSVTEDLEKYNIPAKANRITMPTMIKIVTWPRLEKRVAGLYLFLEIPLHPRPLFVLIFQEGKKERGYIKVSKNS